MTSRSYTWICESANELYQFLQNLIKVYVKYTRGNMPQLSGIEYHETCKSKFRDLGIVLIYISAFHQCLRISYLHPTRSPRCQPNSLFNHH